MNEEHSENPTTVLLTEQRNDFISNHFRAERQRMEFND